MHLWDVGVGSVVYTTALGFGLLKFFKLGGCRGGMGWDELRDGIGCMGSVLFGSVR